MDEFKAYVVGLVFDNTRDKVLLVEEESVYTGIGKKMNDHDQPYIDAMIEVFKKRTNIKTGPEDWRGFAQISGDDFLTYFFEMSMGLEEIDTNGSSPKLEVKKVDSIFSNPNILPSMKWLIPLATDRNLGNCAIYI